jgi:hypothetical protein
MSWGIQELGKPEALKRAIDVSVEQYSGQSKEEFAQAAPHLKGLLDAANPDAVVSLNASGHGHMAAGVFVPEYLNVEIKQLGLLAE